MTTKPNLITHNGLTMSVNAWGSHLGISAKVLNHRLKSGWPLDKALTSERHAYRVRHTDRDSQLLTYRMHLQTMRDQFDDVIAAFIRNVESDARRLRCQMQTMIAERTSIPDDVLMHRGVVEQPLKSVPDRSFSSAPDSL